MEAFVKAIAIVGGVLATLATAAAFARRAAAAPTHHTTVGTPPGPPVPSTPLEPTHEAPATSTDATGVFYTLPEDAAVAPSGWVPTPIGLVTAEPLVDARVGGYAQLNYRNFLTVADRLGASLLTRADVDALAAAAQSAGLLLSPCILPATASMGSRAWKDRADACVRAQLAAKKWDGRALVGNVGKDYTAGAPAGRARIYGWFVGGKAIQPESDVHSDSYVDYSQRARLKRAA
jgi:hypothetical protein